MKEANKDGNVEERIQPKQKGSFKNEVIFL